MRAGITLLADDGDQAVVGFSVTVAVEMLDRLDLRGVGGDFDLVALLAIEIGDGVVAESVDPMVVNVTIFSGHAVPVDRAVGVHMLRNNLVLGIDQAFKSEGVGSTP